MTSGMTGGTTGGEWQPGRHSSWTNHSSPSDAANRPPPESPHVLSDAGNSAAGGPAAPTALLVLGMHRSGTSALTRTLSLLGAQLPGRLIAPSPANPAGFWESVDIQTLNDRVLHCLGTRWDDCGPLALEELPARTRNRFVDDAQALLQREFADAPLFVLKDPRLCRLLPLWLEALAAFGAQPRVVLPLRDPLEVAASLNARNGLSISHAQLLWLRHVLEAEAASRGVPRVLCGYDTLLTDWRGTAERISTRLQLRFPRAPADAAADIDAFLSPPLRHHHRHHHATQQAEDTDAPLADWLRDTATTLAGLTERPEDTQLLTTLDQVRTELGHATQMLQPLIAQQRRRADDARHQRARAIATREVQVRVTRRGQMAENRAGKVLAQQREALQRRHRLAATQALATRDALLRRACSRWLRDGTGARQNVSGAVVGLVRRMHQYGSSPRTLLRLQRQGAALLRSGLFDPLWYLHRYTDIASSGADPQWHWLLHGWREGRAPNPLFDAAHYLRLNQDVAQTDVNPLLHYLQHGAHEGRSVGPLFDADCYLSAVPQAEAEHAARNPLAHFLTRGMALGLNPSPWFDAEWYVQRYPEVGASTLPPLWHFLLAGACAGYMPCADFDSAWYLDANPDVAESGANPLLHFVETGRAEGRAPLPPARPTDRPAEAALPEVDDAFADFERRSLFVNTLLAPFSEQALQVIDQMHALRETLVRLHSASGDAPLVSIILALHDADGDGTAAVASVLAQRYANFELIISGDCTGLVLPRDDARVEIVQAADSNIATLRNLALARARGSHLVFIRAFHRLQPDFLRVLLGELSSDGMTELVYCAQGLSHSEPEFVDDALEAVHYGSFSRTLLENRNVIDLGSVLCSRALLDRCGGFDQDLPAAQADWVFLLRATERVSARAVPCLLSARRIERIEVDGDGDTPPAPSAVACAMKGGAAFAQGDLLAPLLPAHSVPGLEVMTAPAMRMAPTCRRAVSIVIPSFECLDYVQLCVDAVRHFTDVPFELIVVDNASSSPVRDYLAALARNDDKVRVIQNEKNLGFSYAANQGIAIANAAHDIVLLNNDAVVTPGWLGALQRVFEDVPDAGLAVPRQVLLPHTPTMRTHNPACDPERELDVNLSQHHDNVLNVLPGPEGYYELSFAPFFCVYIPRRTLGRLGPLDHESAPHYRSDRLYCEAVRGMPRGRIIHSPHAKVYHFLQKATAELKQQDAGAFQAMFVNNSWTEIRKQT